MRQLTLLILTATLAIAQPKFCEMIFRVVDTQGVSEPYRVSLFRNQRGQDFSGYFANGLRGKVPCELQYYNYELTRIYASGSSPATLAGRTWAEDPENWETVATTQSVPIKPLKNYAWNGRATPAPGKRLWIQLRAAAVVKSAVPQAEIEAEVRPNGEFEIFGGLLEGPYVVFVTNDAGDIVYLSTLKIESRLPREPLLINLNAVLPRTVNLE